jgi:hypothetical protein
MAERRTHQWQLQLPESRSFAIPVNEWEYPVVKAEGSLVPYHFEFDATNQILRCRFEGCVTEKTLREFFSLVGEYIAQTDPRAAVTDLSAVTSFEISPQTIRELAKAAPALRNPSRPRCVVAPSPEIFGMVRMFEIEAEVTRPNLHVVHTLDEAWAILDVRAPQFEPLPGK